MLKIELNEKNYISFIEYAIKTCNSISLVFEKSEAEANDLKYTLPEEYYLILESVIKKENTSVHPNTGSCLANADILFFKIDTPIISFLKQAIDIFDWDGKKLPGELCFYRNEKIWFSCISHERLLHIHNETSDDLDFLKKNKIHFAYEI